MKPALDPSGTAAPAVDFVVQSQLWGAQRGIRALLRRAVEAAASAAAISTGEVAVVLTDDSAMRVLNREWRSKDKSTNVLSFPGRPHGRGLPPHLGDIVIAYQTTAREAEAARKPFRDHAAHLTVHGFLHLVGYDHEAEEEAQTMERLEIAVLARLRVPNPYIPRRRGS